MPEKCATCIQLGNIIEDMTTGANVCYWVVYVPDTPERINRTKRIPGYDYKIAVCSPADTKDGSVRFVYTKKNGKLDYRTEGEKTIINRQRSDIIMREKDIPAPGSW